MRLKCFSFMPNNEDDILSNSDGDNRLPWLSSSSRTFPVKCKVRFLSMIHHKDLVNQVVVMQSVSKVHLPARTEAGP